MNHTVLCEFSTKDCEMILCDRRVQYSDYRYEVYITKNRCHISYRGYNLKRFKTLAEAQKFITVEINAEIVNIGEKPNGV